MHSVTRNIVLRRIKNGIRWRGLSSNVVKKDQYILKSAYDLTIPSGRLIDKIWKETSSFMNLVALVSAETNKSYTYKQLQYYSASFATSLLKKLRLSSQDVVAIALPNCPEYPVVVFGAIQAGVTVTTINPGYKEGEIIHSVSFTRPKVVVTIPQIYETVFNALKNANVDAKIVLVDDPNLCFPDGTIRYSEIVEMSEPDYSLLDRIEKSPEDVAFIPFSSGTTGLPKGVEIRNRNVMASIAVFLNENISPVEATIDEHQDIVPCVLPFFHIYGLVPLMINHLLKGCKLITMSSFHPVTYLDVLKKEKVNLLYVVPPIVNLLTKLPTVTKEHFKHVRHIFSGAAPIASSDVEALLLKAGGNTTFLQGLASTETTCVGTVTYKENRSKNLESCGDPMPGLEMKFCDPNSGKPVPIGEHGELYVRGPSIMKGYLNNPQATKECLMDDGFYKTGDFGVYKEDDGMLLTDRIKELIKVKGMQVAPAELEGILRTHPAVQDVGIVGIPHEFYGEVPKAYIVANKGSQVTSREIQDFIAEKVIDYKRIKEVVFVDSIPKNPTGKILRRILRKM